MCLSFKNKRFDLKCRLPFIWIGCCVILLSFSVWPSFFHILQWLRSYIDSLSMLYYTICLDYNTKRYSTIRYIEFVLHEMNMYSKAYIFSVIQNLIRKYIQNHSHRPFRFSYFSFSLFVHFFYIIGG